MEHNIAQHVGNHQVQVPARVMYEIVRPVLHLQHSTHTVETDSPKRHCEKWGLRTCVQLKRDPAYTREATTEADLRNLHVPKIAPRTVLFIRVLYTSGSCTCLLFYP